ncbi:LmeA family phospholipid-binding protein [Streptomyces qinglanensis]|uniref:LmeA family phospholipid-binding protein n=1 Tax=Streptomyces qinglanensis TaxID=943816 RepID=UPI003D7109D8
MTPHGSSTNSTTPIPKVPEPQDQQGQFRVHRDRSPAGRRGDGPQGRDGGPEHPHAPANPYDELASLAPADTAPPGTPVPNPYEALGDGAGSADGGYGGYAGYGVAGSAAADPGSGEPYGGGLRGLGLRSDDDEPAYEDRMPYLRAVRRRRRSRLSRTVKLGVACCALLAFLGVADRWAALYAEGRAADQVQSALKLHARPEVHINGFPFLTQVARNRLDDVEVAIPDVPAGRVSVAQVSGRVEDVRIIGDAPSSVRGAVLGRMKGDVLLDFDDLDRELGTSQVSFTPGGPHTVLVAGELPVADTEVKVRARARLARTGDHGVGTTVDDMRLVVPKLFSFTPGTGEDAGLRLSRPLAERIRHDRDKARALFGVRSIARRFGMTPEQARQARHSDRELSRVTGTPDFVDKVMGLNLLDVAVRHPKLLEKAGIDPALVAALKKIEEPKLADKLALRLTLPDLPGDVRLRGVSVAKEGIRAELTGADVPFGEGATNEGNSGGNDERKG